MAFIHHPTLLLVDNQQEPVAQMLVMLLKTKGYRVLTASTALAGISQLSQTIDLILFDTQITDIDCVTFYQRLKHSNDYQHIPMIILSSQENKDERWQLLRLGVDDYLMKPFEPE